MSKLEKVLELLINEQREDAERLLHDWFVEQARNIHQELVAEDDHVIEDENLDDDGFDVEEANDEIDAETYFGDKDLAEDEEDEDDELAIDDAEDDLEADMDFGDSDEDLEAGEDADLDLGDDADEDVDLEDKVDDLAAELEALKAEFDAITGGDDSDEELDGIEGDEVGDEEGDDFGGDDAGEIEGDDVDGEEEEDFDDLGEGIVDTLTKVETSNSTSEIAAGKTFSANNTSPIPQKKVADRAFTGKPVAVKSDKHNGYAKESSPATQSGTGSKKPRNVRSTGTDEQSAVVDGGDKSALLNKSTAKPNNKSPIGSKGSIGNDKTPGKP